MTFLSLLAFLPLLAFSPLQDGTKATCDMKKKESGWYCETDKFLLEEKALEKGKCWKCEKKPIKVQVCVKTYYGCRGCSEKRAKPAKCCAGDMAKNVSKARIIYRCPGICAKTSNSPKSCSESSCDTTGKKYRAQCSKSGLYPHGNRNQ